MRARWRRACLWALLGLMLAFLCLSAVACAEHAGHSCASPSECLLCRLIERQGRLPLPAFAPAGLPALWVATLLCAPAACASFASPSLILLHVQLND